MCFNVLVYGNDLRFQCMCCSGGTLVDVCIIFVTVVYCFFLQTSNYKTRVVDGSSLAFLLYAGSTMVPNVRSIQHTTVRKEESY